jgi:hypothetical protein
VELSDWLVATDDGLVERWQHCTLCGRTPISLWGVCGTRTLVLSYVLCQRCKVSGGVRQVERLFSQRYEGAGTQP